MANEQTAEFLGIQPTGYEVTGRDDWGPFGAWQDTREPVYSYEDGHKIDLFDRDIARYREQDPRATLTPDFSNVQQGWNQNMVNVPSWMQVMMPGPGTFKHTPGGGVIPTIGQKRKIWYGPK